MKKDLNKDKCSKKCACPPVTVTLYAILQLFLSSYHSLGIIFVQFYWRHCLGINTSTFCNQGHRCANKLLSCFASATPERYIPSDDLGIGHLWIQCECISWIEGKYFFQDRVVINIFSYTRRDNLQVSHEFFDQYESSFSKKFCWLHWQYVAARRVPLREVNKIRVIQ